MSVRSRVIQVQAFGKLNLALAVGPCAEDGMHPISSWMVTIDLADDLEITRLPDGRLSRYAILWHDEALRRTEIDWSITQDLAVRAHLALERRLGRALPIQLKLEKRLPVGAGLGGGSADAAAMLLGLRELFELDLTTAELAEIAAALGADVPFFLHGGSALVEGSGEKITRLDAAANVSAVVVMPDATCPTGDVYRRFDELPDRPFRAGAVRGLVEAAADAETLFNDLREPATQIAPAMADALDALSRLAERPAHVTGSGAAIFALCDDDLHAEHLARAFRESHPLPAVPVRSR